ncbi:acetyl-CoA acetyltransferase [Cordyceps militaris CM01]|uniref:Acetyl-CoA acetyltransferase n=1 Tax=Cordyceps militaris (strain CM01) TaxID=983644 RepID=G3JH37_CORMM|nr:acetyl-CoA acetyltransferase [Cordyceps militaris CM01]EGX91593.1 acetyl-CoA acetyltransferase [Cordyceps militaris CM01]
MSPSRAVPILVGVGDVRNKSSKPEDALEPSKMMTRAIRNALEDTGLDAAAQKQVLNETDSLRIIPTWTWAYNDLLSTVAEDLGIKPTTKEMPTHGGNQPALQCDEAARAIANRQSKVAILTGGEAMASLAGCQKAGQMPPPGWVEPDPDGKSVSMDMSILGDGAGPRHSVGLPIHVYPLYEIGRRARLRQTAQQNNQESATMYAAFDEIGSKNEYSWNYGEKIKTAEFIGSITKRNRIICEPYPLLMNAFNGVNLSAACILTSTEHAEKLGIPKDKWVYILGGAVWERPGFASSPAITNSLDAALQVSGLTKDKIDVFDFYSQVKTCRRKKDSADLLQLLPHRAQARMRSFRTLANHAKEANLAAGRTHIIRRGRQQLLDALTAMTRALRSRRYNNGLILANGGMLTHQYAICLSTQPRRDGQDYPAKNPLPLVVPDAAPPFAEDASGPATIETYTIEYDRSGAPSLGHIVGKLKTGERFLANHGDDATLERLAQRSVEHVGQAGVVRKDEERNLFYFEAKPNL